MKGLLPMALFACSSTARTEVEPRSVLNAVSPAEICATHGSFEPGAALIVRQPTLRAVAPSTGGDAAALRFTYMGETSSTRTLASGADRHQIGLKLRAQDSCNVIYVMWRADKRTLDVSVKHNPGKGTHAECGANGYLKVRTKDKARVPMFVPGIEHELHAELRDDELTAWIDGRVVWRGELPAVTREILGPAGFRSDNVSYSAAFFGAMRTTASQTKTSCHGDDREDD